MLCPIYGLQPQTPRPSSRNMVRMALPDDGDGDQGVNGDVDSDVEEELREFAGGVPDQPVIGGVVVRHERYADHHEDDISARQVQQQQVN